MYYMSVHVLTHVHMRVCVLRPQQTVVSACISFRCVYIYIHIHGHGDIHLQPIVCVYTHVHRYTYTHIYLSIYIWHGYTSRYTYLHVCTQAHTHTPNTYIGTNTNKQTCNQPKRQHTLFNLQSTRNLSYQITQFRPEHPIEALAMLHLESRLLLDLQLLMQ